MWWLLVACAARDSACAETTWPDADGDGWGGEPAYHGCEPPPDAVRLAGDCDDADAAVHPDGEEVCDNGVDENCTPGDCRVSGERTAEPFLTPGEGYGWFGYSLAMGDTNGDGVDDLLVGAPVATSSYGRVSLFLGPYAGGSSADADQVLDGAPLDTVGDLLGASVLLADLDGDGLDEIVAGAPGLTDGAGEVFVGSLSTVLSGVDEAGGAGIALAAGDADRDGVHDLAVLTRDLVGLDDPRVYVTRGGAITSASLGASWHTEVGYHNSTQPTQGLAVADLDGDGRADLATGDPREDIVYVNLAVEAGTSDVADSDEALPGPRGTGAQVVAADFDGDGRADLAISAQHGPSYVWLLLDPLETEELTDAEANLSVTPSSFDLGATLAAGDLDGDGRADLLVGAPQADTVEVVYGPATGTVSADVTIEGTATDASFGQGLAVGDPDGDTLPDLLIGASYDSTYQAYGGAVYRAARWGQ